MFIAVLLIFCMSTLMVDYIDQGRLVLEFDLLFYAFGKPGTVFCAWIVMFAYTLLVPYYTMVFGCSFYHNIQHKLELSVGTALIFLVMQMFVLGLFPIYVVVHHQLPPASRFIVILEQVRCVANHLFICRESPKLPTFSSYLYFLFCPTLIYRDSYPRPEFSHTFSSRTLVLTVFHSILPGILMLLLCFFAFLHCWLNLFGELLRFSDRMFYKDWWNSTSFTNYFRTWNVVVHDWLYYYAYKDFLWLSKKKFRTAAMLSVFIVSALVHEYALAMGFGFFYPIMFFLFGIFGVALNFALNDKRQSPACNVIMWMSLFLGQGVLVCLYSQEWYAQIHCPRTGVSTVTLSFPLYF
uniref:Sterol O-acyltransferase 2 n=1 Tax=Gouania willdenowi TaxID=441366 RepID=A0A8C5I573_GOUWI